MKKQTLYLLFFMQLFFLSSCGTTNSSEPIKSSLNNAVSRRGSNQGMVNSVFYKDGVYTGQGDSKNYGSEIATITINHGKITDVMFQRLDSNGNETIRRNSSDIKIGNMRQEILKDDIKSNIDLLVNEVLRKQTYDISIPTNNKELLLNWKLAVKRAMEQAQK
jgi:uncharacterized protein with FMN-binding domain